MKRFFSKPYRWAAVYAVLLSAAFTFVLLDSFVIPKSLIPVKPQVSSTPEGTGTDGQSGTQSGEGAAVTDHSYEDENIKINIETLERDSSTVYVADIQLADASYLKTALANDTYGRNIKQTTSEIAERHQAIFAVNGDYYGFRDNGYVVRNGTVYRDAARSGSGNEDLVIDVDGNFSIIEESQTSLSSLDADSIAQVLSFGPALIENGEIVVDSQSEVSRSKSSNPRTAIGQISPLHYVILVSDGRTSESQGLSLLELAQIFIEKGCTTAYNLDGGGSSTMYFNGTVVNNPTDGRSSGEREVSDIVYVGY
ncbi:MAG: phosphodiester glycosidase family protein [Intestinibacillus sp.]